MFSLSQANTSFKEQYYIQTKLPNRTLAIRISALLLVFLIPISSWAVSVLSVVLPILFLSCVNTQQLKTIWSWQITKLICAWLLLLLISCFYSDASYNSMFRDIKKYARFAYICMIIPFFIETKWQQRALIVFFVSLLLNCVLVFSQEVSAFNLDLLRTEGRESLKDSIFTSFFMAIACYWALGKIDKEKKSSLFYLFTTCCTSYYIIFYSIGRTGQVLFIAMAFLFIASKLTSKIKYVACISALLIVGLLISTPTKINTRLHDTINNSINFFKHNDATTSMGERFTFYQNSLVLIKQKPLLGWGTGGFQAAYATLDAASNLRNPHNQYLYILVNHGIFGLIVFAILIYKLFMSTNSSANSFELRCLMLCLAAGCMVNSWFLDYTSMMFFVVWYGILNSDKRFAIFKVGYAK